MEKEKFLYTMHMTFTYQWILFWVTCCIIAIVLCVRLWVLLPLYTDSDVRHRTQALIQATALREGWLLSGVSIKHVSDESVQLEYRSYHRGRDTVQCYTISQRTGALGSCNDS